MASSDQTGCGSAPSLFWRIFYNSVLVPFGWVLFRVAALVDRKAARALSGRKDLFGALESACRKFRAGVPRIWFHAASMGEFEQARPVIAELKRRNPSWQIVVSFFSSSGYDHSRKYPLADIITYIPFDSAANARRFVDLVRPSAAVMVRYDLWPNHVWALQHARVPVIVASATLGQSFFLFHAPVRNFYRAVYSAAAAVLTISEADTVRFGALKLNGPRLAVLGDTRYDQVTRRSEESRTRRIIEPSVLEGRSVFVMGSSWGEDESVCVPAVLRLFGAHPGLVLIIVPHEPTERNLEAIEDRLGREVASVRFSNLGSYAGERVIIIDSVGILMTVYRYADVAFVGGSFRSGIHNVLEPAVYGIPVLVGPQHQNSQEAVEMVRNGSAVECRNEDDVVRVLGGFLDDPERRRAAGERAKVFVRERTGATDRLCEYLEGHLKTD